MKRHPLWPAIAVLVPVWLIAFAVLASLLYWIVLYRHPVPFWDQWSFLADYQQLRLGNVTLFTFLTQQHNEHRITIPRILFLLDIHLFSGRNDFLIAVNLALQAASLVGLYRLLRHSASGLRAWTALGLGVVLMFSAAQAENFFWGFQVSFVGIYASAIWAVVWLVEATLASRAAHVSAARQYRNALIKAFLMGVSATLMMANGVLVWPMLAALCVILGLSWRATTLYLVGFSGFLAFYLWGYHSVARHTSVGYVVNNLGEYILYVLAYLGSFAANSSVKSAIAVGSVMSVFAMATSLFAFRLCNRNPALAGLVAISFFIVASAGVTAFGRLSFGIEQALSSRYLTPATIFYVSVVFAWFSLRAIIASKPRNDGSLSEMTMRPLWGAVVVLFAFSASIVAAIHFKSRERWFAQHQRFDVAADAIAAGVLDPWALGMVSPDSGLIMKSRGSMQKDAVSIFSKIPWSLTGSTIEPAFTIAYATRCRGAFDSARVLPLAKQGYRVFGWAWDNSKKRKPRFILITNTSNRIIGFATQDEARPDVNAAIKDISYAWTGWAGYASADTMPTKAYGLLDGEQAVCEIGFRQQLTPQIK